MGAEIEGRAHAWLEGLGDPRLETTKRLVTGMIERAQLGALNTDDMIIALLGELAARLAFQDVANGLVPTRGHERE